MAAVEVDALQVAYGDRVAVDELTFSAERGEVVALLGRNGAGKTSTVETLEGYRSPTRGRVRVLGRDPVADHAELASDIGVMLQEGGVYSVMTPRRVLRLFAAYYRAPLEPEELIGMLSLEEAASTPYKRLSGGERQRLSLALALIGRPQVCFLDEPTAGVDPAGRLAVRDMVARLRSDGVAVLLTSHELDEVERVADRVVLIDRGRLVASGPPGSLGGGEAVRFRVSRDFDKGDLGSVLGVDVVTAGTLEYRLSGAPSPALVAELTSWLAQNGVVLEDLRTGPERLEDVFLRLVGGNDQ